MYKKYIFGHSHNQSIFLISIWSSPWFLAHRSPKSWNALSDKSNGASFVTIFGLLSSGPGASLIAQLVKNPPAVQETWVQSLGWEDPLEK